VIITKGEFAEWGEEMRDIILATLFGKFGEEGAGEELIEVRDVDENYGKSLNEVNKFFTNFRKILAKSNEETVIRAAKEGLVMELLFKNNISRDEATEFLNISHDALLNIMTKYDVYIANFSSKELERQRQDAQR